MNKPLISIVAVNWWAKEFAELLISSVAKNTKNSFEILIVDNSGELENKEIDKDQLNVKIIKPGKNLGHGGGVDMAIKEHAQGEYILALDIDSHILLQDWDEKLLQVYNKEVRIIGAEGGLLKPIRPLFMFFEKEFFLKNNMSFESQEHDGVKFDVGIHFYFKTLSINGNERVAIKFLQWTKTAFKDVWGEDYSLAGQPMVFHHWYATRWFNVRGEKVHNEIDDRKYEDYLKSRENLFKQIK